MESSKNNAQVLIDGKVLTLSGFESSDYLQQIAAYLNNKISECKKTSGFSRQAPDLRNIVISLNIADDYFKAKARSAGLEKEIEGKDKEMYNLKHELISSRLEHDKAKEMVETLKKELTELQKQIVKLETELEKKSKR